MPFKQIKEQINILYTQAEQLDKRLGERSKPLFNFSLFPCLSRLLTPCVNEAKKNLAQLENDKSELTEQQIEHLCNRLINQISAIQRELATADVRHKEKKFSHAPSTIISDLYQKLAQHQEWERRLQNMLYLAESNLAQCQKITDKQALQQHLVSTENRLYRCQQARQKIEIQIQQLERKS